MRVDSVFSLFLYNILTCKAYFWPSFSDETVVIDAFVELDSLLLESGSGLW